MAIQPPASISTRPSGRGKIAKKLFSRGKKKTNVQELNDASIGANDAVCQPESACEPASMTVIASERFTEKQGCQPTSNLQNGQGSTNSNGPIDEIPSPNQPPIDNSLIGNDDVRIIQEFGSSECQSQALREMEIPSSTRLMRPKFRRRFSETDLRRSFDTSGDTLAHSGDQPSCRSRNLETRSGSRSASEGICQLIHNPPQDEQTTPLAEVSHENPHTNETQNEDGNLEGARPSSANHELWNFVSKIIELRHKNELADLKDVHEAEAKALNTENVKQTQAAEAETLVLQKRIEELESCKATLEGDLKSKQETMESLVAVSQSLQHNNDRLKEQCDRMSKEPGLIKHSGLDRQVAATLTTVEEKQMAQQALDSALNSNRALSKRLVTAQNLTELYWSRVETLTLALEETPNEVANIKGVIEQKDSMFCHLQMRAGQIFTSLTALEKRSGEEKEIARREIATLRAKLEKIQGASAVLQWSRDSFKKQCEAAFEKLSAKADRDDVINAMNDIFQTAVQDNLILQTEIEHQASELSSKDLKLSSLENAIQEAQRSLTARNKSNDELQFTLKTKDVELGALQMELDVQKADHQSAIDEKDGRLADADRRLREAYDSTVELMNKGSDERQRHFIKSKDDQIKALEQKCLSLSSSVQRLKTKLQIQAHVSAENAMAATESEAELEDALARLRAAQVKIEEQQEQLRELYGLPASLNITEVLEMKVALGEAQVRIKQLEHLLRTSQDPAAENAECPLVHHDDLYNVSDEERDENNKEDDDQEVVDENTYYF
ncbi:hypothetical protein MMC29_004536 [Sticta canariensis]|nr:hypothetical protein [Sticta canariensis]